MCVAGRAESVNDVQHSALVFICHARRVPGQDAADQPHRRRQIRDARLRHLCVAGEKGLHGRVLAGGVELATIGMPLGEALLGPAVPLAS